MIMNIAAIAIAHSPLAVTRSLPLQGGGVGRGSLIDDPLPTASRSTSPFQGEVKKARGEA